MFDLLYGGDLSEVGDDTLEGFNVNTIALQVPKSQLHGPNDEGDRRLEHREPSEPRGSRAATAASRSPVSNVQVSRLGRPLVNEVVVPVALKDYFNASKPKNDAQYLPAVQDPELPHLLNAVYGTDVPDSSKAPGIQRAT